MPNKLIRLFLGFLITTAFFFNFLTPVKAAGGQCKSKDPPNIIIAAATWPDQSYTDATVDIEVNFTNQALTGTYFIILSDGKPIAAFDRQSDKKVDLTHEQLVNGKQVTFSIDLKSSAWQQILHTTNNFYVKLQKDGRGDICDPSNFGTIKIQNKTNAAISNEVLKQAQCDISIETNNIQNATNIQIGENFTLKQSASHPSLPDIKFIPLIYRLADFQKLPTDVFATKDYSSQLNQNLLGFPTAKPASYIKDVNYPTGTGIFNIPASYVAAIAVIDTPLYFAPNFTKVYICKSWNFNVSHSPTSTSPIGGGGTRAPSSPGTTTTGGNPIPVGAPIIGGGQNCASGFTDDKDNPVPAIATAIGCIPTEPVAFIKAFLRFILGIGGGIAFLIMVLGVFQMITSGGNPDLLRNGSEMLISAIIGILFIIFSLLFFQFIGLGILNIPGFL